MSLPNFGFGTYRLDKMTCFNMVKDALKNGCLYIDTAFLYKNEKSVGEAILDSGVARSKIFVSTKVWLPSINKGRDAIIDAVKASLENLKLEYIDLVLLHAPSEDNNMLIESWKTMINIQNGKVPELANKIKHIGVSNYNIRHLQILKNNGLVTPWVNQIELNPYVQRKEIVKYCKDNNIKIIAHSPLTKAEKFKDSKLVELAKKHKVTPAQLLIKWCLDNGFSVIPRTCNKEHLLENINALNVNIDDSYLRELDKFDENYFTHPKYNIV